ncbi:phospholipase D-like domain-containing protein [Hahella aquimaris]|uniref:phospholipase D-like domain-containing protein n=1 Tax=Hahella sp. HNIBRBA332 TaxID=3015983 RepID=UPI00273C571D|nr:phospholipase D-like domain-containing protein [Hahella sp. HNIBRBA332]WLQ12293.1 phospholipase D-like domain-containing protein [Hahella sp. HNIBRBA332]
MQLDQLTFFLQQTLTDERFDNAEKQALLAMLETLQPDQVRFMRNRAFELTRPLIVNGGDGALRALKWLERVIKALDSGEDESNLTRAYFSPGEQCRRAIIERIRHAQSSLQICVFTISDDKIADEIINAHKRGLKIRIITDNDKSFDRGSDINRFKEAGISVKMDDEPHHMHHKFALIDDSVLIHGSFNWTRSASTYNQENIVVTDHPGLVKEFSGEFAKLWRTFSD